MKSHGSMNRVYRLIWSEVLNSWVAVAEMSRGRGKGASRNLIAAALSLCAAFAQAAPDGGQIVSGAGSVTQSGTTTTINQATQNLSLTWQSFNIAPAETVNFVQPSASAIAVNRIFDTSGTQILGRLNANGQVVLINPNGILFGQGAQVNVGGLVASTLDFNDASLNVNTRTFSGSGSGSVVNQGTINATGSGGTGGYVALLGNTVSNQGTITAQRGSVALGAGSSSTLTFQNNSLVKMQVDQSVLNSLAENGGLIRADGGMVVLSAGAKDALLASVVNNTGVIEARTVENHEGSIILLGGMTAGTTHVGGTLDASAPNGGNGGFIETSAVRVKVADDAKVTTAAPQGKAGNWLIDPTDYTIAAVDPANGSSYMSNATLATSLGSGNVTIQTLSTGTGNGDIFVNSAVSWSANKLTLNAHRNININANLNASATASLALIYGQGAVALNNTSNIITTNAAVNLPAGTTNLTTLQGSDGVVKNYTVITSLGLEGSTTATDLQGMNGNRAVNYALGSNIDATATSGWNLSGGIYAGFTPVGNLTTSFTGTFDGLGHTISNLTINRPTTSFVGLFGYSAGLAIRNVGLLGGNVSGNDAVGALVGYNNGGTVSNSYATGSVSAVRSAGGLVGYNTAGTVSNSYATGSVSGTLSFPVGGLVGSNQQGGTVSNSYATGNVSGTGTVGGLVGLSDTGSTVTNSSATGSVSVTGSDKNAGGLVGYSSQSTVSNSFATGSVSGTGSNSNVGGLVGLSYLSTVGNSYATGSVSLSGSGYAGGLVGWLLYNSAVSNSFARGNVSGTGQVGGLIGGASSPNVTVSNSYATGSVSGSGGGSVGGLVGSTSSSVSNSYATGSVSGSGDNGSVGGLVGSTGSSSLVTRSYATGSVSQSAGGDYGYVGGLVGENSGTVNTSYATGDVSGTNNAGGLVGGSYGAVSISYATGNVSGAGNYVGGLVGENGGQITNAYATGNVSGADSVGGLVGINYDTVSNAYATGTVRGTSSVGGLIGDNAWTVSNSFWDTQTSGQPTTGIGAGLDEGATGRTTADMRSTATFSSAGWNIANTGSSGATWRVYEGSATPWLVWWLKPLTVTANSDSKTYSGAPYSGGNGVTYSFAPDGSLLYGSADFRGTSQGAINVGSYAITPGLYSIQQGYDISYVNSTLTVNKANLTVTADNKSRLYGAANPALTSTLSGFVNGETATTANVTGAPALSTTADNTTNAGTAVITAAAGNLAATNYDFSYAPGTLTVTAVPVVPVVPPANSPGTPPAPVLNAMAQLQSEALSYRMNNEPQTLNLSPTLTVTQSAGTGSAASSSESVNPAAGSTRMNVNTLMNVNTIVMGPSLQIMNIGATGTTLQIVNGGMRLPDTMANEN